MEKHVEIRISGKVQNIGFRWCTYEKFVELGLVGRAENEADGSVKVVTSGEPAVLDRLVEWCRQGPPGARVAHVDVREVAPPAPAA